MGILTIKVDGEEVTFGNRIEGAKYYGMFSSGGSCGFIPCGDNEYADSYIEYGAWSISLPKEYSDIEKEVERLFNLNVEEGCCGGCL